MTTLHFVFNLNLELFDPETQRTIDKVRLPLTGDEPAPNSRARGIDTTSLVTLQEAFGDTMNDHGYIWIHDIVKYIFDDFMTGYFDPITWKYHMWVRNRNPITAQRLANGLSDIDPERGGVDGWMGGEISAFDEEVVKRLGWSGIDLVPTLHKLYVITETEVAVNQLPQPI